MTEVKVTAGARLTVTLADGSSISAWQAVYAAASDAGGNTVTVAGVATLIGGVIDAKYTGYDLVQQWTSYGWNVFEVENGNDYAQVVAAMKTMEDWDPADRRPMVMIGKTTKGYWPRAVKGKIPGGGDQLIGYHSHPYGQKMNSPYFVSLAKTFEDHYGVEFKGIRDGAAGCSQVRQPRCDHQAHR